MSNAQYQASGALRHSEYGNGTGMNLGYNGHGSITQYSLTGVKEAGGAARIEGSDYQYHANGAVKFATDHYGRSFGAMSHHDKSYQYDHNGRLQVALSGAPANDFFNGTASPVQEVSAYQQTTQQDVWSNLSSRSGYYWSEEDTIEAQNYDAHNRNLAWSYDADGRLISMNEPSPNEHPFVAAVHTYDAAGRHVKNTQTTSRVLPLSGEPVQTTQLTNEARLDGDGQQISRVETKQVSGLLPGTTTDTTYYLRSTLFGQVITEYDQQGVRDKSYVYGGGAIISSSSSTGLSWRFNNPLTGDGRETDAAGKLNLANYLDPQGVDVAATNPADNHGEPPPEQPLPKAGAYAAYLPRGLGGSGRCSIDNMEIGCGFVSQLLTGGAAEQCPNNACVRLSLNGGFERFRSYADGYSNYLPDGISYVGDGLILNSVWTGDGSQKVRFDQMGYGAGLEAFSSFFTTQGQKKRKEAKPKYPPVTASEINIVYGGRAFEDVQTEIVNSIVDIANRQRCSDAFKEYKRTIPYDVVKSGKLKVASVAALYQDDAQQLLGFSADMVRDSKNQFAKQGGVLGSGIWATKTAERVYQGIPTVIFNPNVIRDPDFEGIKTVVIHAFIHLGGQPGDPSASPHDLAKFDGYGRILEACR